MTVKIAHKIVSYAVSKEDEDDAAAEAALSSVEQEDTNVIQMHEKLERPEMLLGSTYKVKTPLSEHALYITVNDVILNEAQTMNYVVRLKFSLTQKTWITFSGLLH